MTAAAYTLNGKTIGSERFYEIACDPRRHVMVEACAGAGKTWMLVSRILRALLDGAEPQQILAITFTKKAAAEMRSRLQEWLEQFALMDEAGLDRQLQMRGVAVADCPALRERLRMLDMQLAQSVQPLQIRTFHSWFAQLTRAAPLKLRHELGLPASYELLEDDSQIVEAVWPRFWGRVQASEALSADLRESIATLGRSNTIKALQAVLAKRAEFTAADAAGVLDGSVLHFSVALPGFAGLAHPDERFVQTPARQVLIEAARALGQAQGKSYVAKAVELEQACTEGHWAKSIELLLNADGSVPAKSEFRGLDPVQTVAVGQARMLCHEVVQARIQHLAWCHQQRMVRLSRALLAEFGDAKRERGWVDMGDIEQVAHCLLNDPEMGGWLQEVLDWRVRHLLIDEFQDTNPLQWQVLHGWLQSYAGAASQAPSIFIVGDPKQSIYRFRRADPQVFEAAKLFVRDGLQGQWLACDHTRRNATAVIGLVNAVMEQATQEQLLKTYRSHTTDSREAGEVLVMPLVELEQQSVAGRGAVPTEEHWRDSLNEPRDQPEEHVRQLEARQAARWIASRIVRGESPGSFKVLARKNERLARMQDELRALGIACTRVDQDSLFDAPEIQDIVALLEALLQPHNDLALARALKSPVFGLDDAALGALAVAARGRADGNEKPIDHSGWRQALRNTGLRDAESREVASVLDRWQTWLEQWPVHDALSLMMDEGRILERYVRGVPLAMAGRVQASLKALIAASLSVGGGRFVSARAFVRAVKDGRVKAAAVTVPDAVELLTIHKAKGLEADTVLLLDTLPGPDRSEGLGILLRWPARSEHPEHFVFLLSRSQPPKSLQDWVAEDTQQDAQEDMHCLYVALTRARKRLVVSASLGQRRAEDTWYDRLVQTGRLQEIGAEPASAIALQGPGGVELQSLPRWRGSGASLQVLCMQETPEPDKRGEPEGLVEDASARAGLALHRLLQSVPMHQGEPDWHPDAAQIDVLGRDFDLDAPDLQRVVESARRIVREQAWLWDGASVVWSSNEMELWSGSGVLRLDRVIKQRQVPRQPAVWWVVDYKSASNPLNSPELVAQLLAYKEALQACLAASQESAHGPVRAGFVTADGCFFELPPSNTV